MLKLTLAALALTALTLTHSGALAQTSGTQDTMMHDAMMKSLGGSFVTVNAPTTGTVTLEQGKDGATLSFKSFKTEPAPDLHVWLYTRLPANLKGNLKIAGRYLDLGSLKAGVSSAEFKLPKNTDLKRYSAVVLWCDQVSTTFAVAKLEAGAMMDDSMKK